MSERKTFFGLAAACLLCVGLVGLSLSQAQTGGERTRRDPNSRGRFDPAEMQKAMSERMQAALAVSADEWKALEPKVMKVWTLSREASDMGGMRGMMGRPGGNRPGGDRPATTERRGTDTMRDQGPVAKSRAALETVLENKDAKAADIKAKLTALREARDKAKDDLTKAQEDLRKVLSLRQEAQLVLMGLLN